MVYLFYRLALEPQHAEKIRDEIHTIKSIYDPQGLKTLEHLNGAINEILRLHPSVPTGGYRESPPQGVEIAGQFIPGNITIVSPRYTMGRRTSSPFLPILCIIRSRMQHGNKTLANLSLSLSLCSQQLTSPLPVPRNLCLSDGTLALKWSPISAPSPPSALDVSRAWGRTWRSRSSGS